MSPYVEVEFSYIIINGSDKMNDINEQDFGKIINRAIKDPAYWDKMEPVIDAKVAEIRKNHIPGIKDPKLLQEVYDIDTTSMYDTKPIVINSEAHTILGKINIPDNY